MGQDGVVEADFVVGAGVLHGRGAGEAVVHEEFVVGVRAVCGEDFFAGFCGVSVLVLRSASGCLSPFHIELLAELAY